jgi:hypothetical protein
VVDLLVQHTQEGRRLEPTELMERGDRVAVRLTLSEPTRPEPVTAVFKVFTFDGEQAVLLQDCVDRDDAMRYLAAT